MLKFLIFLIALNFTMAFSFGAIEDGKYLGTNAKTGAACSIQFSDDGDYAYHRNVEYRITVHRRGPMIKCSDDRGRQFSSCASGAQVSGNTHKERSLYILGIESHSIQKIYFLDSDNDSTNDVVCVNLRKV